MILIQWTLYGKNSKDFPDIDVDATVSLVIPCVLPCPGGGGALHTVVRVRKVSEDAFLFLAE